VSDGRKRVKGIKKWWFLRRWRYLLQHTFFPANDSVCCGWRVTPAVFPGEFSFSNRAWDDDAFIQMKYIGLGIVNYYIYTPTIYVVTFTNW